MTVASKAGAGASAPVPAATVSTWRPLAPLHDVRPIGRKAIFRNTLRPGADR